MKKPFPLRILLFVLTILLLQASCKKVNEATLLGDDLVPEVDNINTFDTLFATETDNLLLNDTTKLTYGDPVALGTISADPEFGSTNAAAYFQISPDAYRTYPFGAHKDSVMIDSVVLSLNFIAGYGDTNAALTVRVYEIAPNPVFNDTMSYAFNQGDFETTGAELGSASFSMSTLDDTVRFVRGSDTTKVANQLRIKFTNNDLGDRFRLYDTTNSINGGYHDDTTFKKLFNGFAIKADEGTGNGLAYFDLTNTGQTALTIYYRTTKAGVKDTTELSFAHNQRYLSAASLRTSVGGQANIIKRQRAGNWEAYLTNGTAQDDLLYIQSTPGGSAGMITIPGLTTFPNALIHRAELIVTRIPSNLENVYTAPDQLFLDKVGTGDTAFLFSEYLVPAQSGGYSYNYNSFGGHLRTDQTYRFNVTSAVQNILTRDSTNNRLRIFAPFKTAPLDPASRQALPVRVLPFPAFGRVVLAGGNYAEAAKRLQLRVIYSKLE